MIFDKVKRVQTQKTTTTTTATATATTIIVELLPYVNFCP